ncbi:MAG: two-component sensor histidine kinase [Bacteroidetes bacterium]|nr:two-component sensor histidine kinase [Bacteroidota bacterium]
MANFETQMKLDGTNPFIAISSIALFIVLIIQVNWIFQTAQVKEELFNEKANLVLARTTDALLSDKQTCEKIENSVEQRNNSGFVALLEKNEMRKIDSLLVHFMNFYSFHVDYSFEVIKSGGFPFKKENTFTNGSQQGCYSGLILIVLFMFWRTVRSLMKEKIISEHTNDFLNNMTHEFKTPLTNISLAGKMIMKDSNIRQEEKIKHYSEIILEENEKLRLQVEQVLSMTALERGEIPLQKTELDFHKLIHDSLKCISIQIENKQGNCILNLNANNFVIMGDKTHFTNALCNLIDNAIKYSKEKPELTISTTNTDHQLVIVISDNGIGIEKDHQKKVFDKFFRVPTGDVHNVKGFGLGLAYVKKIVELHGGTIELLSEKDEGTTFTITLPNA